MHETRRTSRESEPTAPALSVNFDAIKSKPERNPRLEEFHDIFGSAGQRQRFFEGARETFRFMFRPDEVHNHLEAAPNKTSFKHLKRARRSGLILKASYNFFDKTHLTPQPLQDFLKDLGKHNDHYENGDREKHAKKLAASRIHDVANLDLGIEIADDENFRKYLRTEISRILTLLESPRLPLKQFHELRKKIRIFADSLQVAAAEDLGGNLHWLFASLLELSVSLGEKHDEYVQSAIKGKHAEDIEVEIDPQIKEKFLKLLPYIGRTFGMPAELI